MEPLGVYVHFPWCVKKCPYCDFNSHPLRDKSDLDAYLNDLLADISQQLDEFSIDLDISSVFLGGGTPSLFSPDAIEKVLRNLPLKPGCEVTMEANPGTTEHADFSAYRRAGVNRLSIGAQSFNDTALTRIGRIHSAQETHEAFANARRGGFTNINLDLMWGLPQQSTAEALTDLATAIDLAPEHISWYQLTIEPKTEFARRTPLLPQEATMAAIEIEGFNLLAQHGYERYEVSAFARDSTQRCAHNVNYWQFGDYLGFGAGAHGKITRRATHADEIKVLRTHKASQPRLYQTDPLHTNVTEVALDDLPLEFMMNALRLVQGVQIDIFTHATGVKWSSMEPVWSRLVSAGWVAEDRIATTAKGMRYLDSVLAEFMS